MSCADVMYQPYTPYFPYQRPHMPPTATATATVTATAASSPADLLPIAPYDVKAYTSGFQNWRGLSHMNTSHLPEGLFPLENLKHKFGVPKLAEPMEQGSPDFVMGNGMLNSPMNLASSSGNNGGGSRSASSASSRAANSSSTASAASSSSANGDSLTANQSSSSGGSSNNPGVRLNDLTTTAAAAAVVTPSSNPAAPTANRLSTSSTAAAASRLASNGKASCAAGASTISADSVKSEIMHATDAQYISANCVLFTYYSGDISAVIDEHFSRALSCTNQSKGFVSSKDNSPMSQRNFPPSFWNSHYVYQGGGGMSLASLGAGPHLHSHAHPHSHPELSYGSAADPYHHAASTLHGIHQGDPWHYPLTSQAPYSHRPMHHELTAYNSMAAGQSTFSPQYGSLLLQPPRSSRLGAAQCSSLAKPSDWSAAQRYHDHLTGSDITSHLEAANYGGGYTSMCSMPEVEARGFFQTHEGYN